MSSRIIRTIVGGSCVTKFKNSLPKSLLFDLLNCSKGPIYGDEISSYFRPIMKEHPFQEIHHGYIKDELVTINGSDYRNMEIKSVVLRYLERGSYIFYNREKTNKYRVHIPNGNVTTTLYYDDMTLEGDYPVRPKTSESFELAYGDMLLFPDAECAMITVEEDVSIFTIDYGFPPPHGEGEVEEVPAPEKYDIFVAMTTCKI